MRGGPSPDIMSKKGSRDTSQSKPVRNENLSRFSPIIKKLDTNATNSTISR